MSGPAARQSARRWLLGRFAAGNKAAAMAFWALAFGAVFAFGITGDWHHGAVWYSTSAPPVQHLVRIAGLAWAVAVAFMPNKRADLENVLGSLDLTDPLEWLALACCTAASCTVLVHLATAA